MEYLKIRQNAKQFKALTSLSTEEFDGLLPLFTAQWENWIAKYTLSGKVRTRKYVPRQEGVLYSAGEKLFFIMSYHKTAGLQEYHAASFGLGQDMCNKWIHVLTPLLEKAVSQWRPGQGNQQLSEGQECALDGTESPIERPVYDQKGQFSGKKGMHTYKHLLLVALTGTVLWLSPMAEGKRHDKRMADEMLPELAEECRIRLDLGFLSYRPKRAKTAIPHKKPKGKELTKRQKAENRKMARERVFVEHAIGHIKTMRIVKDKNRNRKFGFRATAFRIAVCLHNFRCEKRRIIHL